MATLPRHLRVETVADRRTLPTWQAVVIDTQVHTMRKVASVVEYHVATGLVLETRYVRRKPLLLLPRSLIAGSKLLQHLAELLVKVACPCLVHIHRPLPADQSRLQLLHFLPLLLMLCELPLQIRLHAGHLVFQHSMLLPEPRARLLDVPRLLRERLHVTPLLATRAMHDGGEVALCLCHLDLGPHILQLLAAQFQLPLLS